MIDCKQRVVIIGAGISGLSAAYSVMELTRDSRLPVEIVVLEASSRFGGVIETESAHGCLLEFGPDAFITQKPWALELCNRINIDVQNTNKDKRTTLIVKNGKLVPVPDGFMMIAPSKLRPFVFSPIFSLSGKMRMAMEYFLPPLVEAKDETLSEFVTRRLGREALERVAQPMLGGIYAADPARLSLKATMPRFIEMERSNGGILRSLLAQKPISDSGARYSMFVTAKKGLGDIVERLKEQLPDDCLKTEHKVQHIEKNSSGRRYRITTTNDTTMSADAVIVATPAHVAASLLEGVDENLPQLLSSIRFASTAVLNLIFRRESLPREPEGFGFVCPAIEKLNIMACTFASVKFPHRASEGLIVIRAFLGGELQGDILKHDDAKITDLVMSDLRKLLGITAPPVYSALRRHRGVMPQYDVGHIELVEKIEAQVEEHPGLALAGNSYRGIGIPDCVRSAQCAAQKAVSHLSGAAAEAVLRV